MAGIRTITGFLKTSSGPEVTFTLMTNHFSDSSAAEALRDQVLEVLQQQ